MVFNRQDEPSLERQVLDSGLAAGIPELGTTDLVLNPLVGKIRRVMDLSVRDLLAAIYRELGQLRAAGERTLRSQTSESVRLFPLAYQWSLQPTLRVLLNRNEVAKLDCILLVEITVNPLRAEVNRGCLVEIARGDSSISTRLVTWVTTTAQNPTPTEVTIFKVGEISFDANDELELSRRGGIPLAPGALCSQPGHYTARGVARLPGRQ
jgi:hypothetical protein